jgi:tetratricopeptide (TPR) repeat protein
MKHKRENLPKIRRLIEEGQFDKAYQKIKKIEKEPLSPAFRAQLLKLKSFLWIKRGFVKKALNCINEAISIFTKINDYKGIADSFMLKGEIFFEINNRELAIQYLEDAVTFYRKIGETKNLVKIYILLGGNYLKWGEYKFAQYYYNKAQKIINTDEEIILISLCNGILNIQLNDFSLAKMCLDNASKYLKRNKYPQYELTLDLSYAWLHLIMRNFQDSRKYLVRSLEVSKRCGYILENAIAHEYLGELAYWVGDYKVATRNYDKALEVANKIAPEGDLRIQVERRKAEVLLRLGDLEGARKSLSIADRLARRLGYKFELGVIHRVWGEIYNKVGDWKKSSYHFKRSLELLESMEEKLERGKTLLIFGELMIERDPRRRHQSLRLLLLAEDVLEKVGVPYWIGRVNLALSNLMVMEGKWTDAYERVLKAEKVLAVAEERELLEEVSRLKSSIEVEMRKEAYLSLDSYHFVERLREDGSKSLNEMFINLMKKVGCKIGFLALGSCINDLRPRVCYNIKEGEAKRVLSEIKPEIGVDVDLRVSLEKGYVIRRFRINGSLIGVIYADYDGAGFGAECLALLAVGSEFIASRILREYRQEWNIEKKIRTKGEGRPVVIARSQQMIEILEFVDRVKDSDGPILLLGETGTGKDLMARYIHSTSKRRIGPFVVLNSAALPMELVESELFGYEKGAFTGAYERRKGKFEEADGGTIFLNDIGDMPLGVQAKLLGVLDYGEFEPLGSNKKRRVYVRVIAASNKDLAELVRVGKFRRDLYHRLSMFVIELPPLRERREDIPLLLEYFIGEYSESMGVKRKGVSKEAMELFCNYDWPGNVRELRNEVMRIMAVYPEEEVIEKRHISGVIRGITGVTFKERVERYERYLLEQ